MHNDFMRQDSIKGFDNFAQYWLRSLEKIQKRLGLERYNALLKLVNNALSKYKEQGDHTDFYPVVEELLVNYYDPMYDYQIKKKISRVVFKGNSDEVLAYLSQSSKD
jgi:tRNA 2-selenouridine synthase